MTATQGEKERFVQQMICQIIDGTLPAGYRLPTESELAAQFGIAKTNVHLGVKELERYGMVKIVPRHAMYIEDTSESITLEGVNAAFRYTSGLPNRATTETMLELREMMACGVIRWMVRRPDRAHMQRLTALCSELEQAAEHGGEEEIYRALLAFLMAYYLESGNDIFPLLVRSFRDIMAQAVYYLARYAEPKELAAVYRSVLHHIEAEDLAAAQRVWTAWNNQLSQRLLSSDKLRN